MELAQGSVGSTGSLSLRLGQAFFSSAALVLMSLGVDFYSFTAFCFLVTVMGLIIPWSSTLAMVDMYSICIRCPPSLPGITVIILIGDGVLSMLALGASCATSGVVDFLVRYTPLNCPQNLCTRYQLSAATAFVAWLLIAISSICNLWSVASM